MRATRTYLEMRDAAELRAAPRPQGHVRLERLEACPPAFYRFLYAEVGRARGMGNPAVPRVAAHVDPRSPSGPRQ